MPDKQYIEYVKPIVYARDLIHNKNFLQEQDISVDCYVFLSSWTGQPRLKVVAGECEVYRFNGD
ncbi:MAG: hypothetical protein AAGA60_15595 [Cyanobacteria bacterium P01_E01_bin.42]